MSSRLQRRAVFVLFLGAVFATGLTAVADGDIFWHLAAGRWMVDTGRILRSDPFSTTAYGRPWVDVHWLFQLGAYGLHRAGGLFALVLGKAALVTAGAALLFRTIEAEAPNLRAPFALTFPTALFLVRHLLPVRPIVLTLLFLAVFFWCLEGDRRRERPWAPWLLPVVQIFWVNVQGLAPLGPALIGCYLVAGLVGGWLGQWPRWPFAREDTRWRPHGLALAGCLAASFVSPYGARAAVLPLELLARITPANANVFAAQVAENIPPFVLERTAPEQIAHFKWCLAALALSFAFAPGRLLFSRVLLTAGLAVLALMANRNVLLLYWLATPVAVMNLAPLFARVARARWVRVTTALSGGLAVGLATLIGVAVHAEPSLRAPTPFRFPTESAVQIAKRPGTGTIFAPDHQGGYLIWSLFPRYRPYLDTRLILRTADEFRGYLELLEQPERFDALDAREAFDYVVLPTGYPDRYLGLAAHLARSPGWSLVFTDGQEVLYARGQVARVDLHAPETTRALVANLERRYRGQLLTAARLHLARLDLLLGNRDEAEAVLAPMTDLGARALRARARLLDQDLGTAETLARSVLVERPGDVASLCLLARIALLRGDAPGGAAWLRRALQRDPFDAEALALLDRMDHR